MEEQKPEAVAELIRKLEGGEEVPADQLCEIWESEQLELPRNAFLVLEQKNCPEGLLLKGIDYSGAEIGYDRAGLMETIFRNPNFGHREWLERYAGCKGWEEAALLCDELGVDGNDLCDSRVMEELQPYIREKILSK